MFAEHLLKGRNTHVSLPSDFIKEFNITLADKAPVFFRHREAFIPYESLVTMAIVDETDKPRPISTEELLRYKKGEATDPLRGEANPLLEQLRSTETRFKAPYAKTYLTYENSGVYDRRVRTVVFHDIAGQPEGLLLPPDKRVVIGKKLPDGTVLIKEVTLPYRANLAPVLAEARAIASSLRAALPVEIAVALKRVP
jgi:hypothetical protein